MMPDSTGDRNQDATLESKRHLKSVLICLIVLVLQISRTPALKSGEWQHLFTNAHYLHPPDPLVTSGYHGESNCGSNNTVGSRNGELQE